MSSRHTLRIVAACLVSAACSGAALAQTYPPVPQPQNVLQLQASGSVEVQQDLLRMTLSTTREGAEPGAVQAQLKTALEAALAEAKRAAAPGQMDVRTGNFSLNPRYSRDGKIASWQGRAELVLEGRDFARISATAGRIPALTLANVSFSLSREQRAQVEAEAQSRAIEAFKTQAGTLARGFGFSDYTLREVSVNASDQGFMPRLQMMAMAAKSADAAEGPVPVEAGKSTVVVTVSGSVQLR